MSKIRYKDTIPEILFRKRLWHLGYRYRINVKSLPGKPDVVFSQTKVIIFIDGEFWHGYNWDKKKEAIKSNRQYWIPKIERNMARDIEITNCLQKKGWKVIRFWEHEVRQNLDDCVSRVIELLQH